MNRGKIEERTFYSDALQEDMTLLIYLPATYSPLYKYSLLIASDGKDYFQLGRISRVADELLAEEEIENLIIVGIPYENVKVRRTNYHPNGDNNKAYMRFLAQELVPYLDAEFPTYQIGMGRGLIGDSLAATVSLMTACAYPHTFGKVILHSPYVNETVLETVKNTGNTHFTVDHIIGLDEKAVPTGDGVDKDFLQDNRELSELFEAQKFSYRYEEQPGGHTWKTWQKDMKRALQMNYTK
ncbi:alpha/beta hydrolase-fold protein [Chryseomicrobium sp. FSL W7-1435]|uniref:alpha/beta hydrolase n=1 Tax=Chryseomicrobium sp. FSL W7-1435 TaxID=2921704 RepID=UPI00315B11CC